MPFDFSHTENTTITTPDEVPTWIDEIRARVYVGRFKSYMREEGSCMSSGRNSVRLTPIEEELLCRQLMRLVESGRPQDWTFDGFHATHKQSKLQFWISNGTNFLHIDSPQYVAFRKRSQNRLYRALHRLRHKTVKGEADELIQTIKAAADMVEANETR